MPDSLESVKPKKTRSTKDELDRLDNQIVKILESDHPQSVRHVFYRMTDPRLPANVPKTENGYRLIVRRCLFLRRSGRLPYGWISDSSRAGYHVQTFGGPGDFVRRVAGMYRAELWTPELPHVEVWVESRSLAGVLRDTCRELAVSLYPSGGFSSATLCHEAAQFIDNRKRDNAVVCYVGDHDPAGVLIDKSIEAELRRHLKTPLEFRRLAVNQEQIEKYDLPSKPRKPGDRRRLDIQETTEAEAIPADLMRRMVRDAVESYLPQGALHAVKVAEESERESLKMWADTMDDDFMVLEP